MTEETGADLSNRDIVERFFAASERGDADVVATLVDDEMVMEWPQSGERFVGRENVLAAMRAVEVKPEFGGQPRLSARRRVGAHGPPSIRRRHPPVRCRPRIGGRQDQARNWLLGQPIPAAVVASTLRRR